MNYKPNKQRLVIGILFTLVVAYSASGEAAEPVAPEQTLASPDYAAFGKQIDMQITTCEQEQKAICVSVVIPFDLFKRAMKALHLVDKSI